MNYRLMAWILFALLVVSTAISAWGWASHRNDVFFTRQEAAHVRVIPSCARGEVLVGVGPYDHGLWESYECTSR